MQSNDIHKNIHKTCDFHMDCMEMQEVSEKAWAEKSLDYSAICALSAPLSISGLENSGAGYRGSNPWGAANLIFLPVIPSNMWTNKRNAICGKGTPFKPQP
jgi:hypothetical protein